MSLFCVLSADLIQHRRPCQDQCNVGVFVLLALFVPPLATHETYIILKHKDNAIIQAIFVSNPGSVMKIVLCVFVYETFPVMFLSYQM